MLEEHEAVVFVCVAANLTWLPTGGPCNSRQWPRASLDAGAGVQPLSQGPARAAGGEDRAQSGSGNMPV